MAEITIVNKSNPKNTGLLIGGEFQHGVRSFSITWSVEFEFGPVLEIDRIIFTDGHPTACGNHVENSTEHYSVSSLKITTE